MTLTPKGKIQRDGRVNFGDASLNVWEEGISAARAAGGYAGEKAWELAFKRQVFARIVQTLNRLGWTCTVPQDYVKKYSRSFAENRRECSKGDLKGWLDLSGRHIEFKMWQGINTPTRPDHGGRYESNKEACMPYLLRLEMERTRRRIRDYLCSVFAGYEFEPPRYPAMGLMGLTAEEKARHDRQTSGHYKPALDRAEISMASNARARDGGTIEHGARVWALDHKGRVITGTAYYSLNNRWQIVTGRYGLTHEGTESIFTKPPENLRVKRNERERRRRLESELAKAVRAMDFRRAEVLKGILWPKPEPLFYIMKNGAYFAPNYCGYRSNPIDAGKYTQAELAPYASSIKNGELKAIPVAA